MEAWKSSILPSMSSTNPTFLIGTIDQNGNVVSVKRTVVGAMPFNTFKAVIDPLLLAAAGPAQAKK
jgi:hypothetical protein